MPVSSQQLEYAKGIVPALAENPRTGEPAYTRMKRIKPKGLRGSILKHIGWPTSWAVLYDLSPAQISQNREPEKAREVWGFDSDRLDRVNVWKILLRGYFYNNPEPMSESAFPSWRKPSWMSESDAQAIRNLITNAYENEGVRQRADGEVSLSAEQTEDVPREQRMADLAEQEEAEAVQIEEEQAEAEGIGGRSLIENLYQLYSRYWQRSHGVASQNELYDRRNNVDIRRALISILTLEKLGYEYRGIKDFTDSMQQRNLQIFGLRRATRAGYNAYLLVDLKGANANASRYRSSTAYGIMALASRTTPVILKQQFEPSRGRALQVMRFTGRGSALGGFQLLSLNVINGERNAWTREEGNRKFSTANNESIAQLDSSTSANTPQTSSVQDDSGTYYFLGFQQFSEGQTYRQNGEFNISLNKFPRSGTFSFVFYFGKPDSDNRYELYRNVFGPLGGAPVIPNQNDSIARLGQLKLELNRSGRLDTESSIKLERLPVLDKRKLRQAFEAQVDAGLTSGGIFFPVTRNNTGDSISVPFSSISYTNRIQMSNIAEQFRAMGSTSTLNEENDELAGGSSVENDDENARIAQSVAAIKTQKIDRTFAYEIEAGMFTDDGQPVRDRTTALRNAIDEVLQERGLSRTPDGVKRWLVNEGLRSQQITMAGDGSVDSPGGFEIDTPVFVPANVDLAKTNYDEAVQMSVFNEYKWQSYPKMWEWVAVLSEALLRCNVRIHKSSGLHIHVSNSDYTMEDKGRYLRNYAGFEPLLDLMMPINSRRGGRSYNASLIQKGIITTGYSRYNRRNRTKEHVTTPYGRLETAVRDGSTRALGDIGGRAKVRFPTGIETIEFRHPMTNIEGDLIKHFIILAYGLVEVSKIKQFKSFKFDDLASFLPPATATFLYNRIEDLDQPSVKDLIKMNITFNEVVEERNSDGDITGYKLKPRKEQDVLKEFNEKFYVNDNRSRGTNDRGTGSALKRKKLGE